MSGDSPNAFSSENVFDFKEGRASPAATTSKEHQPSQSANNVVQASVLVEPQQKEPRSASEEDAADFGAPVLHQNAAVDTDKLDDAGDGGKKEELKLLNGLDRLPNTRAPGKPEDSDDNEDKCLVNCIYYTMECCKCSII